MRAVNASATRRQEKKLDKLWRTSAPLKLAPILDKARTRRDLVVKRAGDGVGFVGVPIDPARSRRRRGLADGLDQRAGDPSAARCIRSEKILQIAIRAEHPGRA